MLKAKLRYINRILLIDRALLFFLSCLLLCQPLRAQEGSDKIPLIDFLQVLEEQYNVRFSYRDLDIQEVTVSKNERWGSLSDAIELIESSGPLAITRLNERYYAIRKKEKLIDIRQIRLVDEMTLEPVGYAMITAGNNILTSDTLGLFDIDLTDGPVFLSISHIGYLPYSDTLGSDASGRRDTIRLASSYVQLEEVIVPFYFITGLKRLDGGILSFTPEDLPVLPGLSEPDVFFSMQALPGIQSASESVSDINIRGGRNDQNLVLWNDIRMYQTGHFFGLISLFNPYLTEKVTVLRSGTRARYGNAVSGTIDVRQGAQGIEDLNGEAGMNMLGGDIILRTPIGNQVSANLSARRSISDLLISPTYKRYFNRAFRNTAIDSRGTGDMLLTSDEKFRFADVSAIISGKLSPYTNFQVSLLHTDNFLRHNEIEEINGFTEQRESSLNQKSTAAGFSMQFTVPDSEMNITTGLTFSKYRQQAVNQDILNDQRLEQSNQVADIGMKAELYKVLTQNLSLRAGYYFNEVTVDNRELLDRPVFEQLVRQVVRSHVLMTDLKLFETSKISGRAGLRASFYEDDYRSYFEPRLTVNYALSEKIKLEISGEAKHQVISQVIDLQTDFLGVIKQRWVAASDSMSVPVVTGKQVSAGAYYNGDDLLVSTDIFYKQIDGIITSAEGFRNQFEFIRATGEQKIAGLELLINKEFKNISVWSSYSVMSNSNSFTRLFPADFPSLRDIFHQVTAGIRYKKERLQISGSINYRSGTPFTEPSVSVPVSGGLISYNDPNSSRLSPYLRLDLSGRYAFDLSDKIKAIAGLSVWNLTGNENMIDTYYRVEDGEISRVEGFALRFTPNAFFRVLF